MNAHFCTHDHVHPLGERATHPIELRYGTPAALLLLAGMSPQRRRALLAHRIAAHSGVSNCGI
jgi:hypothetical protein